MNAFTNLWNAFFKQKTPFHVFINAFSSVIFHEYFSLGGPIRSQSDLALGKNRKESNSAQNLSRFQSLTHARRSSLVHPSALNNEENMFELIERQPEKGTHKLMTSVERLYFSKKNIAFMTMTIQPYALAISHH
jgi:hypothetical protein